MNLFSMKIMTRIILSFLIILLLSMAAVGFLFYEIKNTESIIGELYNTFIVLNNSRGAEVNLHEFDNLLRDYTNSMKEGNIDKAYQIIAGSTVALESSLSGNLTVAREWIKDEKGKIILADVEQLFKNWQNNIEELTRDVKEENVPAALQTAGKAKTNLDEYLGKLAELTFQAEQVAADFHAQTKAIIDDVIIASLALSIVLLAFSILIAVFISRNISKSLSFFKKIFSKGASGDLEARYPVKPRARDEINELGVFFNNFMDKVHGVIKEVIDVSNDLGASSEELSSTLSSFSDNSQGQAASSEEITATMEEISAGVDNVSDNSQFQYNKLEEFISLMNELSNIITSMAGRISEAQGLSKNISEQAKAGNESLSVMDMIMNKITESSNKVSEIVDIIDTISNKINLLSLNAAIEAARAGEAGRGFAVVADEISKLADQTALSISDIDSLIKNNKNEIANGMKNVLNTVDNIGRVIEGVESINDMMVNIFSDMEKQQSTNESVNQSAEDLRIKSDVVRSASEEQRTAVAEAMKSITNINDLIQASASGAEEMTANANKLALMAESLKNRVSFFKVA